MCRQEYLSDFWFESILDMVTITFMLKQDQKTSYVPIAVVKKTLKEIYKPD